MGLSVDRASWPAPAPAPGPHSRLPISPSQGFVFFSPLFPVCDKQDSCQPNRALSPCPRLAVYLSDEMLWLQPWSVTGSAVRT